MGDLTIETGQLAARYQAILEERMRDLPIVNSNMVVETVGFREHDGQNLGILITPWFMNLVMLPVSADWTDNAQGNIVSFKFPCGPVEFTVCCDDELGTFLSAILFRSVTDMPDQDTAREIALQVMAELFDKARNEKAISRRSLFTGLKAG